MAEGSKHGKNQDRSRTRRGLKGLRIGAGILFALILLVIIFPYLIPGRQLKEFLTHRIAAQTNATVQLDTAAIGWGTGLQIGGLDIKFKEDASRVHIDRMHIPFEPLRLLTRGQLSFVKVGGITVNLDPKAKELNLFGENGTCGQINLPISRIQISDLAVRHVWPDGYQNRVMIPSLILDTDARQKSTSFAGQAQLEYREKNTSPPVDAGRLSLQGLMRIVQRGGEQCFAGTVKLGWRDINLAGLRGGKESASGP